MKRSEILNLPDKLSADIISRSLATSFIGKKVYYFPRIDSTNSYAIEIADKGADNGTIVIADFQRSGKGRGKRSWFAPAGKDLLFSVVLLPPQNLVYPQLLNIAAAIAVSKALKSLYSISAQIKWPNDVIVGAKKLCGVLTEIAGRKGHTKALVVGIGINVNQTKKTLPPKPRIPATSIRLELGREVSRLSVLVETLKNLEVLYKSLSKGESSNIVSLWKNYSSTIGKQVYIKNHLREIVGTAIDVEKDGSLVVREDSGFLHKCISGDVTEIKFVE